MNPRSGFCLLVIVCLFPVAWPSAAQKSNPPWKKLPELCLSETEELLVRKINAYRIEKGLQPVPLSASLTYVAQLHAWDLAEYGPTIRRCNLHSWSNHGSWSSCCYTDDPKKAPCMWNKPRELTNYLSEGYEVAYWTNEELDPEGLADHALRAWKRSPGHNEVIVNQREWRDMDWKAMGVGCYRGYAVVWFGTVTDPENDIHLCAE